MYIKKLAIYLTIFFLTISVNLGLVLAGYRLYARDSEVKKVISEIDSQSSKLAKNQFQYSGAPFAIGNYETKVILADGRVANLKSFFRKYNSPLYDLAPYIVTVSDKYGFDYRLVPAIAMQESNLCKVIPYESHNCWGWGIYGDTVTKFASYEDAIDAVSKGLKEKYIDQGLLTASAIMKKYAPSSNGSWQYGVNTFLKLLE